MKQLLKLSFILLVVISLIGCANEESKRTEEAPIVEKKEPVVKKKKADKTDPLIIIGQAPEGMTAASVVDNYFEVIGGKAKAKNVQTIWKKSIVKDTPDQNFELVTMYKNPNLFFESTAMDGEVFSAMAFNGKKGYGMYEGKKDPFTIDEIKSWAKVDRLIFPDFNYQKGKLAGVADVKGEKCYVIDYKNKKVYYGVDSGLRVAVIEVDKDEDGSVEVIKKDYTSDYRDVKGLKFPFRLKTTQQGVRSVNMEIQELKYNEGVSDQDFI